jgi:hypothetical protein
MPITMDLEVLARATGITDASVLENEMTGCAEFLRSRPSLQEMTGTFMRSFQEYFGVEFQTRVTAA